MLTRSPVSVLNLERETILKDGLSAANNFTMRKHEGIAVCMLRANIVHNGPN